MSVFLLATIHYYGIGYIGVPFPNPVNRRYLFKFLCIHNCGCFYVAKIRNNFEITKKKGKMFSRNKESVSLQREKPIRQNGGMLMSLSIGWCIKIAPLVRQNRLTGSSK